jgi:hypothetical protein
MLTSCFNKRSYTGDMALDVDEHRSRTSPTFGAALPLAGRRRLVSAIPSVDSSVGAAVAPALALRACRLRLLGPLLGARAAQRRQHVGGLLILCCVVVTRSLPLLQRKDKRAVDGQPKVQGALDGQTSNSTCIC